MLFEKFGRIGKIVFLAACAVLIAGCGAGFKNLHQELSEQRVKPKTVTLAPLKNYRDFKGVVHVHTALSHDSKGTIEEILKAAARNNLDFVILNDHQNPRIFSEQPSGLMRDVLVIRGTEIIKEKTDVLAIAPQKFIGKDALTWEEIVAELRDQDALIVIAHAEHLYPDWEITDYDAIEIYDIFDDVLTERWWKWPKHLFNVLCCFKKYPEEVILQILDRPRRALKKWDELTQKRAITGMAGNDSHQNVRIFGLQLDPYWLSFRIVSTHVLAEKPDQASILEALQRGRAYISFDIVNGNDGFQFYGVRQPADANQLLMMGEKATVRENVSLTVKLTDEGKIKVIRNGKLHTETVGVSLEWKVNEAGVYRVEVERKIGSKWLPWIISNPIYINE